MAGKKEDRVQDFRVLIHSSKPMQRVPAQHSLLALHHVPLEYDEAAIKEVLDCLDPCTVRIMWSSKDFQVSAWSAKMLKRPGMPMISSVDSSTSSQAASSVRKAALICILHQGSLKVSESTLTKKHVLPAEMLKLFQASKQRVLLIF